MNSEYKRPKYTPEFIKSLQPQEIFVFGSNLNGYHSGGAAKTALDYFGAIWGKGVGPQGQAYAIPTMQGPVDTIRPYVNQFIDYAKEHNEQTFLVTPIGCGIAGFKVSEIAPLFKVAIHLDNIVLPYSFHKYLTKSGQPQLPYYLKSKTYGQTRTLVDLLIELNKTHHYTSPDDALDDLFKHIEHIRTDGDTIALNCSLRCIKDYTEKCFVQDKLDLELLKSVISDNFDEKIDKIFARYVIEKTVNFIAYLNDFRQYTYNDITTDQQLYKDFKQAIGYANNQGPLTGNNYFSFSNHYVRFFLCKYIQEFWEEFSTNGVLDNDLFYEFMVGRHQRGIEKYGIEAVINRNYKQDGPCHPEVYFPYRGGAGPVYVQTPLMDAQFNAIKRQYVKSCGEGKGPYSVRDFFEFNRIRSLIEEDEKYVLFGGFYLPRYDVTLPVFDDFRGRILFESPQEQAIFIRVKWDNMNEAGIKR